MANTSNDKAEPGRFLLLMRHASRHDPYTQAYEIARGLHDYINETKNCDELAIERIICLHPANGPAEKTAWALIDYLKGTLIEPEDPCKYLGDDNPLDPEGKGTAYRWRPTLLQKIIMLVKHQSDPLKTLLQKIISHIKTKAGKNAILIIGHSPQIEWLLHKLLKPSCYRRWLPWYRHAFAAGEIICVKLNEKSLWQAILDCDWSNVWSGFPPGRAIWSLAPTDSKTEPLLREKIKGKMESAKLLGGIVGAGLGLVLTGFHDLASGWSSNMDNWTRHYQCETAWTNEARNATANAKADDAAAKASADAASAWAARKAKDEVKHSCVPNLDRERVAVFGVSISLLALAAGLYWLAYLSYDLLLMPPRFWATTEPLDKRWQGVVWRPPSSSLLVMHQNMQRIWYRTFIPATGFTGLALLALAYSATIQTIADAFGNDHSARLWFIIVLVALVLIFAFWARRARPFLGAQD